MCRISRCSSPFDVSSSMHGCLHILCIGPLRVEILIFIVILELLLLFLSFIIVRHHGFVRLTIDNRLSNRGSCSLLLQFDNEFRLFIFTKVVAEQFWRLKLLAHYPQSCSGWVQTFCNHFLLVFKDYSGWLPGTKSMVSRVSHHEESLVNIKLGLHGLESKAFFPVDLCFVDHLFSLHGFF